MILVTGATGTVGRALIDELATTTDQPTRALTRRPDTAGLPAHVEVVAGDLGAPGTLEAALRGVDGVFLLSAGPEGPEHDQHLAAAAVAAGVGRIVKLSTLAVDEARVVDPITRWHRAGERAVREAGVPWTFLRPTGFMSNTLAWAPTIADHDTAYHPYGAGRLALIDPRDIAAAAATVLTRPGHEGRTYALCGPEALGPGDEVAILAEVLGRPLRYVEVTPEAAHEAMTGHGMPAPLADAVLAKQAASLDPEAAVTDRDLPRLIETPPRTFRDWARDHAALFTG
jgi:uncharacterized protein YbjT (DUF2867 family)